MNGRIISRNNHSFTRCTRIKASKRLNVSTPEQPGIQVIQISRLRYIVLLLWIAMLAMLSGEDYLPNIKAIVNVAPLAQIEKQLIVLAGAGVDRVSSTAIFESGLAAVSVDSISMPEFSDKHFDTGTSRSLIHNVIGKGQ